MFLRWIYVCFVVFIWHFPEASAIECYDCNSAFDPRCGEPFDSYSLGTVDCSRRPPLEHLDLEPTLCRKITQMVYGRQRVIRGCGYILDEHGRDRDGACVKRDGSRDVFAVHCVCTSDLCNRVAPLHRNTLVAICWTIVLLLLIL